MRARGIIIYKLFSIWQCKTRSINLKVIDFVRINRNIFSSVVYLTLEKVKLSINFVTFISLYKHKLLYKLDLLKYIYIDTSKVAHVISPITPTSLTPRSDP